MRDNHVRRAFNGKSDAPSMTNNIASDLPRFFRAMKTLDISNFSISPLLFQLAARLELPALRRALKPTLRAVSGKKNSTKTLRTRGRGGPEPEYTREAQSAHMKEEPESRKTLFQLRAPAAQSVKLVADFTDWEKYPLDMIRCDEGNWFAIVPLTPGNYSYRFIVDGQWLNDPQAPQTAPNPFGTTNAIVQIQ